VNMQKNAVLILLAGMAGLLSGCNSDGVSAQPAGARPHYANPRKDVARIARIILLEPKNLSADPQISVAFTSALSTALERKSLFGQTVVYRKDPVLAKYQMDYEKFPLETLREIRKAFGCDAIMTGVIRDYRTYPRMTISVRLRLVDISDGDLIWAVEQVWDSTDKELSARMKGFFEQEMRGGYEPLNWKMGLVSPNVFNKFVCYEIGETLTSSNRQAGSLYRLENPETSK
jgi:hypothetical protein